MPAAGGPAGEAVDPLLAFVRHLARGWRTDESEVALAELEQATRLARLSEDDPRRGAVTLARARRDLDRKHLDEALALTVDVLERARDRPGWLQLTAEARQLQAERLRVLGDLPGADLLLEAAAATWSSLGNAEEAARCLNRLGASAAVRGDHDASEVYLGRAIALVEGNPALIIPWASITLRLARLHYVRGDLAGARALVASTEPHLPTERLIRGEADNQLGEIARAGGDLEGAVEHFLRAAAISEAVGMEGDAAWLNVAWVRVQQGRAEEANAIVERLLPAIRRGHPALLPGVLAVRLAALAGEPDSVAEPAWEAFLAAATGTAEADLADALELAGARALAHGHPDRARRMLDEAARRFRALGRTRDAVRAEARTAYNA